MGAVYYILKPVNLEELEIALEKIKNKSITTQKQQINSVKKTWKHQNSKIILSLQDSFQVIDLNELLYCETDKGYTTFYSKNNKKHMASKTLKEF
ncbi:LytTR family DNA-binding domain-containing protein [Aquimarina sp. I32.4]|uniref:LytR/AlgR family response regulator transcription factor n=1 Tax=Aquimarina sp. I32.4 TaxID=2053903 RepID=UPI001E648C29|nr:hypothetical protein [Aquimarina sp. I32.4]